MRYQRCIEVFKTTANSRTYTLLLKRQKINEWGLCIYCPLYDGENAFYGNYIRRRKSERCWKSYRKKQYKVE